MENKMDRITNLYTDWYSSLPTSDKEEAKDNLQKATTFSSNMDKLFDSMGADGTLM
jgi:hypothetical protein